MFEKFLSRFYESTLLRLLVSGLIVLIPVGFITAWLGAAYLKTFLDVDFFETLFNLLLFGGGAAFLTGALLLYAIERWIIRDRALTSWKWVNIRIILFVLAGIPEGYSTLIGIRMNMQQYPPLVEAIYFLQTTAAASVIGILYTMLERAVQEMKKREAKLKSKINALHIEIDQLKRKERVEEITGSDFFQDIKERAAEMRDKGDEGK